MAGLDDLIGGLTNSGSGGSGSTGGTGLEDILGGILGGGQGSGGQGAGGQGGGLADILGGILGSGGGQGGGAGGIDDILGGILDGASGQGSRGASGGAGIGGLIAMLAPLIGTLLRNGGLSKILSGMQASGLSAQADSWVGTGANEAVSAEDVRRALGDDEVAQIAGELGVEPDQASEVLAGILPGLVNTVTPDGQVPSDEDVDRFADVFAGLVPSS